MKKKVAILLCMVTILTLTACSKVSKEAVENDTQPTMIPQMDVTEYEDIDTDITVVPLVNNYANDLSEKMKLREAVDADYIKAVDEFSYQIAALLLKNQQGNTMLSPISLQMALALVGTGAEGTTREEIFAAMGLENMDIDELSKQNANLFQLLCMDNEFGKLQIANSLWLKDSLKFKEDYLTRATVDFYASSYQVDFSTEVTAELMSKWVWENTGKLLAPVFTPNKEQILSVMNTIYFKDEWSTAFDEKATAPGTFYLADGTKIECDFMNKTYDNHIYQKGDGFISTSLYLKNNEMMHFILPEEGVTIEELLSKQDKLAEVINTQEGESAKLVLKIPKFTFGSKFSLIEALKTMGITSAFKEDADFHGIIEEGAAFISGIEQQTHIGMDEKGVEAAAYTAIMLAGSAMPKEYPTVEFILDRPFLFVITSEDTVLFMGVVNNPLKP